MRPALALAAAALLVAPAAAGAAVPQPASPKALVVMIPGSGFNGAGVRNAERMSFREDRWRAQGFRTKVAPYRRGKAGLGDVMQVVSRAARAAPRLPLCVYGESSGGTWALLVAARLSVVRCAIVLAAPTDQETLAQATQKGARHLASAVWPKYFGSASADDAWEPFDVWSGGVPQVPVLMAYSDGDPIVPPQQGELLAPLSALVELRVLRHGSHQFVHAKVQTGDFWRARHAAEAMVAGVGLKRR